MSHEYNYLTMKWLIVGLGNPGERYANTRHNAGFLTVESMAEEKKLVWKEMRRVEGWVAETREIVLLKPDTFMNASGVSVKRAGQWWRVTGKQVIVVHDDLDLPLGSAKVGWARGPHGHKGVLSVETELGTKDFWRVRVGVESRTAEERRVLSGEKYVLKPLTYVEKKAVEKGIGEAINIIGRIMRGEYAVGQ